MKKIILLLILLYLSACVAPVNMHRKVKTLVVLANNHNKYNAIIVSNNKSHLKLDKTREFVGLNHANKKIKTPQVMSKIEFDQRFSNIVNALPKTPPNYKLYLTSNHMKLTDKSKKEFELIVKKIIELAPCIVDIIGHTDTKGSYEDNLECSFLEANSIKAMLQEKILKSLSSKKEITLNVKGYGEEDLLIQTSDNQEEAKNRYIEIVIR